MNTKNNRLVYFMTALLALLCIAMVVLFAEYLRLLNLNFRDSQSIPYSSLKIIGSDNENTLNADNVLPALIAVRSDGNTPEAVANNTQVISELYSELSYLIASALHISGERENQYTVNEFLSLDNYVYIRYDNALPYQITGAYAAQKSGSENYPEYGSPVIFVQEMFIFPGDGGTGVFVADNNGALFDFSLADEIYSAGDIADLLTVYSTVMADFDFAENMFALSEKHLSNVRLSIPVINGAVVADSISYTDITGMLISQTPENLNSVLRMFNFNPDKLAGYTENDGTDVFVETHGVMRVTESTVVYNAVNGGGVSLSFFGEMKYGAEYDVYSILIAADAVVGKLREINKHILGGDGTVKLASVVASEGRFGGTALTVKYEPYYDNIRIKTDCGYALSFTVEGGILTDFTLNAFSATSSGTSARCYSAKWLLQSIISNEEDNTNDVIDDISLLYDISNGERFTSCEWNVRVRSEAVLQ